jgi:excisionase family DNA binding protein
LAEPMTLAQPDPLPKRQALPTPSLRLEEVGDYLQLSRRSVYRLLEDGRLKAIRVGAWRRVRLDDLIEFVSTRSS